MVNVFYTISLKNMQIVILLPGITFTTQSGTRQTRLPPSFYMTPSEIFIRNNKNMINIFDTISLKNIQIVILLLQLHHV